MFFIQFYTCIDRVSNEKSLGKILFYKLRVSRTYRQNVDLFVLDTYL